jgi:single-strand DNA-binding protein
MQNITISGNVGKDAELRTVRDTQVLSFNVGVKNGFGRDAASVWYRCSLWGKAAEAFSGSINKGTKVFISGELTHDEYDGKAQFNVRVGSIDTGGARGEPRPLDASVNPSKGEHTSWDNNQDLDDSIPF